GEPPHPPSFPTRRSSDLMDQKWCVETSVLQRPPRRQNPWGDYYFRKKEYTTKIKKKIRFHPINKWSGCSHHPPRKNILAREWIADRKSTRLNSSHVKNSY